MVSPEKHKALYTLRFPHERKSLEKLSDRFDHHLNIIRDKHVFLMGENCLDSFSISLKIVDLFPEMAMNLNFNRFVLEQLHDVISEHGDYDTATTGHYLKGLAEATDIVTACMSMMDRIRSWIPAASGTAIEAVDKPN